MAARNYTLRLKGFVGDRDFDDDYVDYILEKYKDQPVTVLIDSTGGRVKTALSISAAFAAHGDVTVHYVGMNASAATIASMGAKKVTIDAMAMYLVHRCSAEVFKWADMNAEEIENHLKILEKTAADLRKLDINIAGAYARRCKKPAEDLHKLMEKGGWMTAQEALEWGFVDEITNYEEDPAPELDDITAKAFASEGIPLPDIKKAAGYPGVEKSGLMKRIKGAIDYFFNSNTNSTDMDDITNSAPAAKEAPAQAAEAESQESAAQEETASKQPAQQTPGTDAKDAEIAQLKAKIAELEKTPAAEHKSIVETHRKASADRDFFSELNEAKDLFNALP